MKISILNFTYANLIALTGVMRDTNSAGNSIKALITIIDPMLSNTIVVKLK